MACYGSGAVRTSMAFLAGVMLAVGVLRRGLVSTPPRPLPPTPAHAHRGWVPLSPLPFASGAWKLTTRRCAVVAVQWQAQVGPVVCAEAVVTDERRYRDVERVSGDEIPAELRQAATERVGNLLLSAQYSDVVAFGPQAQHAISLLVDARQLVRNGASPTVPSAGVTTAGVTKEVLTTADGAREISVTYVPHTSVSACVRVCVRVRVCACVKGGPGRILLVSAGGTCTHVPV